MKIRKANTKDIKECLEIQKLDKESYWKEVDFKKFIKTDLVIFLVAEEDKKIVGYVIGYLSPTKRDEGIVHETRVHKKYRKRKIGTKLVNELCKKAFKKGAKSICAEIKPEHLRFYRDACKFKEIDKWIEVRRKK